MKTTTLLFNVLGLATGLVIALAFSGCDPERGSAEATNSAVEGEGTSGGVAEEADALSKSALQASNDEKGQRQRFTRIWHEDSGVPIEEVPTPKGFAISPAQAYHPLRSTTARPVDRSQWHLFVDSANYYIGDIVKCCGWEFFSRRLV